MPDDDTAEPGVQDALRAFALTLPEAWEDHPWGDTVSKVRKKIFAFHGSGEEPSIAVKLPESAELALQAAGAAPTGYGLGRSGWVTIPLDGPDAPPAGLLEDWVEESYRAVAPKTLVKHLDDAGGPGGPGG